MSRPELSHVPPEDVASSPAKSSTVIASETLKPQWATKASTRSNRFRGGASGARVDGPESRVISRSARGANLMIDAIRRVRDAAR